MKTGNTTSWRIRSASARGPQWSPVMKTGNTGRRRDPARQRLSASMEPGHEDREYAGGPLVERDQVVASMEPGHEDREYAAGDGGGQGVLTASMEPGHEDREYPSQDGQGLPLPGCLNGARS